MSYESTLYKNDSIYKDNGVYKFINGVSKNTIRFLFDSQDYSPVVAGIGSNGEWSKVDDNTLNIWDWTKDSSNWSNSFKDAFKTFNVDVIASGDISEVENLTSMFQNCTYLKSVCDLNASGASVFASMFYGCTSLEHAPYINTPAATNFSSMFNNCTSLKNVPLYKTALVQYISWMFYGCRKVENGALAFYTQLSTQTTPPSSHTDTFKNCGADTENGSMELAQIPSSWGGTGT